MRSLCRLDMQGWFIICKSRAVPNYINGVKIARSDQWIQKRPVTKSSMPSWESPGESRTGATELNLKGI